MKCAIEAKIIDNLSAGINVSWSDFTFEEFELGGENFEGNTLPGIPMQQYGLSMRYLSTKGLNARIQFQRTGKIFLTNDNQQSSGGVNLLNANLSLCF